MQHTFPTRRSSDLYEDSCHVFRNLSYKILLSSSQIKNHSQFSIPVTRLGRKPEAKTCHGFREDFLGRPRGGNGYCPATKRNDVAIALRFIRPDIAKFCNSFEEL